MPLTAIRYGIIGTTLSSTAAPVYSLINLKKYMKSDQSRFKKANQQYDVYNTLIKFICFNDEPIWLLVES